MKLKTILVSKPENLETLKKKMSLAFIDNPEFSVCDIAAAIFLPEKIFKKFTNNLLSDSPIINAFKHLCIENKCLLIQQLHTDVLDGIIVNPSGFNYARYAGVPVSILEE